MQPDVERLKKLLGRPELDWLMERIHQRLRRGESLDTTLVLARPTEDQRQVVNRLFGRVPRRGVSLRVSLPELDDLLRHAGVCSGLREATELLKGPIEERGRRQAMWAEAEAILVASLPGLASWLGTRSGRHALRLATAGRPERAGEIARLLQGMSQALPAGGLALAELAARTCGDAHAFDKGLPLASIAVRLAAVVGGLDPTDEFLDRRSAWASVGVLCDELSAPVLVLNLRAVGKGLTDRALRLHGEGGEPYRLSIRQLLRTAPTFAEGPVFVCENPAVLATAADRLGARCASMLCVEGQPRTAAMLLMRQLVAAGSTLHYHGDFDWPGVRIANRVMELTGARPWRFDAASYRLETGCKPLSGLSATATWDAELEPSMRTTGTALYEEQVLSLLLPDLEVPDWPDGARAPASLSILG